MMEDNPVCLGFDNITSITPTICSLMNVPIPNISTKKVLEDILSLSKKKIGSNITKCLVYAPDAIGYFLTIRYKDQFEKLATIAPYDIRLCTVFPPKTPICFASMFTGALPHIHGREKPERTVLKCETIFDTFIKAGKKVAIVAVKNSSIDLIFRERALDYFTELDDENVTRKTIELLEKDQHDLIIAYHQEYDDILHETTPISDRALIAMNNHIESFLELGNAFNKFWKKYNRLILFTPDHGGHINKDDGRGTHGNNIPEDMVIRHYYNLEKGENE
ncbi:MAG: hypothetical protein ACTSQK_06130 [Candidatus Heimdallarchaeota archaeon]